MSTETRARCTVGSASATAFVFDDRSTHNRHAAVVVYSDGSGSITIYDSERKRQLASLSINDRRQWQAIAEAINAHAGRDARDRG